MKTGESYKFDFEPLSDKSIKSLKILELIRRREIISRTEISKATAINIVSISNYMNKYIDDKLVIEKGFDVSTGGRKPELIELDRENNHVAGVSVNGGDIHVVLADIGLNVIRQVRGSVPGSGAEEISAEICRLIQTTADASDPKMTKLRAVGIGMIGEKPGNIAEAVSKKLGVDAFAGDAASCAAFGEKELNKETYGQDILYIYSDLGYGVVVREDGHRISQADSQYLRPWGEAMSTVNLAKADVARGVGTTIVELTNGKIENITEETVIKAASQKDDVALSIMRSVGMALGLRIAYLVNLFRPKVVVAGGGIEKAGDLMLGHIRNAVKKLALKDYAGELKIMPGILAEEAVSLGAATLAAREIFLKE